MEGNRVAVALKTMSTNATDERDGRIAEEESESEEERYAELNIGDEEFVIYDRQNHQAWIQSSVAVSVSDLQ